MAEISIIVPIYNTGRYLEACLKSISEQSFKDFECILVDDGSTDNSFQICKKLAESDERFTVLSKKNGGVSSARNYGIDHSCCKWITFVDSDDTIEKEYLNYLYKSVSKSDLIVCKYDTKPKSKNSLDIPDLKDINLKDVSIDSFEKLLKSNSFFGPYCKLFRKDIIRIYKIKFPIGCNYGEDLIFNFEYLKYCNKMTVLNVSLYNYYDRSGSLSNKKIDDFWNVNMNQWRIIREYFVSIGKFDGSIKKYLYQRLLGIVYNAIYYICKEKISIVEKISQIRKVYSMSQVRSKDFKIALNEFNCSNWIKFSIRHRLILPFIYSWS